MHFDAGDFFLLGGSGSQEKLTPTFLQRQQMPGNFEGLSQYVSCFGDETGEFELEVSLLNSIKSSLNEEHITSERVMTLSLLRSSSLR